MPSVTLSRKLTAYVLFPGAIEPTLTVFGLTSRMNGSLRYLASLGLALTDRPKYAVWS